MLVCLGIFCCAILVSKYFDRKYLLLLCIIVSPFSIIHKLYIYIRIAYMSKRLLHLKITCVTHINLKYKHVQEGIQASFDSAIKLVLTPFFIN